VDAWWWGHQRPSVVEKHLVGDAPRFSTMAVGSAGATSSRKTAAALAWTADTISGYDQVVLPSVKLTLTWTTCRPHGRWCRLKTLDLDSVEGAGVYLIWHSSTGKYLRVGQGDPIRDRLRSHQTDLDIFNYVDEGEVCVTWATVDAKHRDGVERFLGNLLISDENVRFPDAPRIRVNLPE